MTAERKRKLIRIHANACRNWMGALRAMERKPAHMLTQGDYKNILQVQKELQLSRRELRRAQALQISNYETE